MCPVEMNFVEPIRDPKKISQIKNQLKGSYRFRDLLFFTMGINTALRVSDLLSFKIGDVLEDSGQIVERFWIREHKRGKRHEIVINQSIQECLGLYIRAYPEIVAGLSNPLFFNLRHPKFRCWHQPQTSMEPHQTNDGECRASG